MSQQPDRDPAEVRRERRIRRAALLVLDGGLRAHEPTRNMGVDAAAAEGVLGPVLHEQMLSIVRFYLRGHTDVLAVFEAALAAEEHEHDFGDGPVAAEAVAIRIILLLRRVLADAPDEKLEAAASADELSQLLRPEVARERLTEGVQHELMLYLDPPPGSPEGLT